MGTLKQEAKDYTPKKTKNIADLPEVSVDIEVLEKVKTDDEGKEFTYKYIEINDEEYRVPDVVLGDLKEIIAEKPNLKRFKVSKKGEGLKTRYTVITLD